MEYYEKHFSSQEVHLYVLCDWHYGSARCDEKLVNRILEEVKKDSLGYWVAIGDLHENNLELSTGSAYDQSMNPEEQLYGSFQGTKLMKKGLIQLLEPIKDKGLLVIEGNHGYRTTRFTGLAPDRILASELGVPYKGIGCFGKLKVKDTTFKILLHHGCGGGRTIGGKINAALRIRDLAPTVDLTVSGHTHVLSRTPSIWFDVIQGGDASVKRVPLYEAKGWDYVCGSTLEYSGSYAERKLMPPAVKGQMMIKLFSRMNGRGDKKQRYELIE